MNPRLTTISTDKHGRRNTNNARQKAYRLRKAGHVEGSCPLCSKTWHRPNMHCLMFEGVTVADAEFRKKLKEANRHYRFLRIRDYEKAKTAYRQTIMEVHPDHGGDPAQASWIIKAWDERKKEKGWDQPTVTETA